MPDSFTIAVDTGPLLAAMNAVPALVERHVLAACKETADRIVADARARASRAFQSRSGQTEAGIQAEIEPTGNGYRVVDRRGELPNLPLWLEKGTKLDGQAHVQGRHFFYAAADVEVSAHQRRIAEAVAEAIEESGLGD